jgi:hypothetical protein
MREGNMSDAISDTRMTGRKRHAGLYRIAESIFRCNISKLARVIPHKGHSAPVRFFSMHNDI